ncbi:MAG TPA: hypothetical protein VLF95_13025 [Vicinamibacteria bacterium]|nr:hypothetical protein [Vicinamibacteria bacterium]
MGGLSRSALLVFLLLAVLSASLAARAWLLAPKGTVFVGTFYYVDDFYNYLSYVEQAERGALVFRNKLVDPSRAPSIVNLEWLAVGWLSALFGGSPLVAYRVFGLAALAALVAGVDRWLARCGLAASRRLAGLLLVFRGGGLGGALLGLGRLPGERALDVRLGAFPFVEAIANPHFLAGTALLLAALGAFAAGRPWLGAALGTALGLVRPYDAALLAGVEGLAVVLSTPLREWPRRLVPVGTLGVVLGYNAWLLLGTRDALRIVAPYGAAAPSPGDIALALGPAALLALTALRLRGGEDGAGARLRLALWASLALLIVLLRPVSFSLQFVVGVGVPLLALAAVGLARVGPRALEVAVPLMASTAAVATWLCAVPSPNWHVAAERWRVASALRQACRPGDEVLSPPDIGLYVGGLTPCWPWVSHGAAPDFPRRSEAARRFYGATPAERAALLDEACIVHVVVPAPPPKAWLPEGTAFRPRPSARGSLPVWSREVGVACEPSGR